MDKYRLNTMEKAGIVIDFGVAYTKIGFVGENAPRKIIRTPFEIYKAY